MLNQEEIFRQVAAGTLSKPEALNLLKNLNQQEEQPITKEAAKVKLQDAGILPAITDILVQVLHLDTALVDEEAVFKEIGVDSISGVEIVRDLNNRFDLNLDAVVLYDYPSVKELAGYLETVMGNERKVLYFQPEQELVREETAAGGLVKSDTIISRNGFNEKEKIIDIMCNILHLSPSLLDEEMSFKELGIDSVNGLEIVRDINQEFNLNLDAVVLYDYPTIDALCGHISSLKELGVPQSFRKEPTAKTETSAVAETKPKEAITISEKDQTEKDSVYHDNSFLDLRKEFLKTNNKEKTSQTTTNRPVNKISLRDMEKKNENLTVIETEKTSETSSKEKEIAIIGMSGRFPKASNTIQYWENLIKGRDCIISISEDFPKERMEWAGTENKDIWMGALEGMDEFDPLFFNISPVEAEVMDPQQRIFLQECYRALEDAGYSDIAIQGKKCGVFAGTTMGEYHNIISKAEPANKADVFTGVSPSILPARISYYLNLIGPSIALDTACSSSLVAIHEACQSIKAGDCDMALAGGIRLMLTPDLPMQTKNAGMMSPTGKCRAFDQSADGIVLGEGVGVVVLKEVSKAKEEGDYIYGVIKASGVNQDGKTNGITAPSSRSQALLEQEVYEKAKINPEDITLVEAHGTGTKLGDPIEVKALKEVFGKYTNKKNYCALSSVKNNIGHTTMAAGVCSVIKVLLALKYKQIPPLIHYKELNEHISLKDSPFYINTEVKDWDIPENKKRLAAVSSFGFSGTNCHLVIEEA